MSHLAKNSSVRRRDSLDRTNGAVGIEMHVICRISVFIHILRRDLTVFRKTAHHGIGGEEASLPVRDRHGDDIPHLYLGKPRRKI